jgi:hypothetical protein
MVRAGGAWRFATYRWDTAHADGILANERGEWVHVDAAAASGQTTRLDWWVPGELGCRSCHGLNAPDLLAVSTRQLAFDVDAGHIIADQVVALAAAGWLARPRSDAPGSAMPRPDDDAPIEARARAWLHGNCAHCHSPGAYAPADFRFDLRADTPLAEAGLCDVRPLTAGASRDARLIVPGDPSRSYLLQRILAPDAEHMPPDGGSRVDERGVTLLSDWIASLKTCPEPD